MSLNRTLILAVLILLPACTAARGHRMLTEYLDNGIGRLTFEDVVKRWNSPDELIEGEETITGIWIREDYVNPHIVDRPFSKPSMFGERKTLIFDRETRLLKSYNVEYY